MFIFAKHASKILGYRGTIGRDQARSLGLKVWDGPPGPGGMKMVLFDNDEVLALRDRRSREIMTAAQGGVRTFSNADALKKHAFRNTQAAMDSLELLHQKVDGVIEKLAGLYAMWESKGNTSQ